MFSEIVIITKKRIPILLLFFVMMPRLSAQDREPLIGTWRLSFPESTFASGPPSYSRVTCKIDPWEDGLKVTYDMVGKRGGVTHWEWMGTLDGKDYTLQGIEEVVTNAYRQVGDRAYEVIAKVDGRIITTTGIVISSDGKVMTVTSNVANAQGQKVVNTAVYKKR